MDSSNNNNNHLFLCEFKELRNEISAMKKRIVQLEESHEKQQERLDILESENHALKTQLNLRNGIKAGGSTLKKRRTDNVQDQVHHKKMESRSTSTSVSGGKKKTKTNNNDDDDEEAVLLPQYDNGDSFDSLSDDLLHKIVEFDGNCYNKFGLINKRCKNIYDVKEYKLKKQTCVYGYGTLDMMIEYYLQKRREGELDFASRINIAYAVIWYSRFDAIDWIIQLGDEELLRWVCSFASYYGRIDILSKVFSKFNLTMLDEILVHQNFLWHQAAYNGKLETLKWVRKYGANWDEETFYVARENGHDEVVQYLRCEGCPEPPEDWDESSGSEQLDCDDEDGDY